MPWIKKRREYFVSTADNNSYSNTEEDMRSWCPHCESYGHYNLLKERIYKDSELVNGDKPYDFENWLQCYRCGLIVSTIHAKQESEIVGIKEVPDSIYDTKKIVVEHFIEPRRKLNVNSSSRRIFRANQAEDDPDIQKHLKMGGRLISYESTNDD